MKTRLTPLEIQQQKFTTKFRGYNTAEVDQFLDDVAETVRAVLAENDSLKENAQLVGQENKELKSREDAYKRLMLNSQKVVEQMKENSKKSAEVIVAQAEMDAGRIMQGAHDRLLRMHEDINDLKRLKIQLKNQLKSILSTHTELLEIELAEPESPVPVLEETVNQD